MKPLIKSPAVPNSNAPSNKYPKNSPPLDDALWHPSRQRNRQHLRNEALKHVEKEWLVISARGNRQWHPLLTRRAIRETARNLAKMWQRELPNGR